MQEAGPTQANLQNVSLMKTNLKGAIVVNANLQGASLHEANLQSAGLVGADLRGAALYRANLQGAYLHGIKNWTLDQIKSANQWGFAHYDPDLREALGLSPEETIKPDVSPHPDSDQPS